MKYTSLLFALLFLGACATTDEDERPDPVEDFVAVNEMPTAKSIFVDDLRSSEVIDEKFVIITTRREIFLIEYAHRCVDDPMRHTVRPDVRRDSRRLYASSGTFRGCQIKTFHKMTEAQADELRRIYESRRN